MIRLYMIGGIIALCAALGLSVYFLGVQAGKGDQIEGVLDDANEFNEGAANPDGVPWYDRLFPSGSD